MQAVLIAYMILFSRESVLMQYDDGAGVLMKPGSAGVWFHAEDFIAQGFEYQIETVEIWFLHHSSFPWDTSEFLAEVWTATEAGSPQVRLCQTPGTAQSYVPVEIDLTEEALSPGDNFVIWVNTELSAGGWPSLLSDSSVPEVPHSISCTGWVTDGDLLVRTTAEVTQNLNPLTWSNLKTVFGR